MHGLSHVPAVPLADKQLLELGHRPWDVGHGVFGDYYKRHTARGIFSVCATQFIYLRAHHTNHLLSLS